MFFSFPTSFLCFSWNSFAASSCGQSPRDRLGQRQAEKEAQKKGEGQKISVTSTHPAVRDSSYQRHRNIKCAFGKVQKDKQEVVSSCCWTARTHARTHPMGLARRGGSRGAPRPGEGSSRWLHPEHGGHHRCHHRRHHWRGSGRSTPPPGEGLHSRQCQAFSGNVPGHR